MNGDNGNQRSDDESLRSGHENPCNDLGARDAELAARLAQTLQNSADALDVDTRARLAAIRHHALARSRTRKIVGGLALAASVLALIATPWMLRQAPQTQLTEDNAYLSVDPEMLADMDMLQAIGEVHE